jgi:hydrogenase nickel incorporation protein HypA/HybF
MHEFSLARSIADLVEESALEQGIQHVRRVTVVIGEWSAVLPEALESSFEIICSVSGPLFEGTAMQVERRPAVGRCTACGSEFPASELGLACPRCGGPGQLTSGSECYVDSYEGD